MVRRFIEEVQNAHDLQALDLVVSPDFHDFSGMTNPPTLQGSRDFFAIRTYAN